MSKLDQCSQNSDLNVMFLCRDVDVQRNSTSHSKLTDFWELERILEY